MLKRPSKKEGNVEEKMFELIKKVKYENSEIAYQEVYKIMKPYIDQFCRQFMIAGLANDDIEQECLFALRYKAIDDFNPKRGKFKTFAVLCIKRHLFSLIKGNKQHKKKVNYLALSLDETRDENGEELVLRNIIADENSDTYEQVQKKEDRQLREDSCRSYRRV